MAVSDLSFVLQFLKENEFLETEFALKEELCHREEVCGFWDPSNGVLPGLLPDFSPTSCVGSGSSSCSSSSRSFDSSVYESVLSSDELSIHSEVGKVHGFSSTSSATTEYLSACNASLGETPEFDDIFDVCDLELHTSGEEFGSVNAQPISSSPLFDDQFSVGVATEDKFMLVNEKQVNTNPSSYGVFDEACHGEEEGFVSLRSLVPNLDELPFCNSCKLVSDISNPVTPLLRMENDKAFDVWDTSSRIRHNTAAISVIHNTSSLLSLHDIIHVNPTATAFNKEVLPSGEVGSSEVENRPKSHTDSILDFSLDKAEGKIPLLTDDVVRNEEDIDSKLFVGSSWDDDLDNGEGTGGTDTMMLMPEYDESADEKLAEGGYVSLRQMSCDEKWIMNLDSLSSMPSRMHMTKNASFSTVLSLTNGDIYGEKEIHGEYNRSAAPSLLGERNRTYSSIGSTVHFRMNEGSILVERGAAVVKEYNVQAEAEEDNGALLEEQVFEPMDNLIYKNLEDDYEIFDLRIIHRKNRTGFEVDKEILITLNTLIAGRYNVTGYLGSAAFSKVIQARDLQTGIDVSLKIIKNNKDYFDQSLDEIKLMKYVNKYDPADNCHILRLYDYFYHQEHLIIVSELLRANLYEFQKLNQESGAETYFTLPRLQAIAHQCLEALAFLHLLGIIHCDIKPENILFKSYKRCKVKIIDLGSSCFLTDNLCMYVQSRSYRAPEVILGLPYDEKIDIWSLGCVLVELCTGEVLFPNEPLVMILSHMIGVLGPIDADMLNLGQETYKYFTEYYDLYYFNKESNKTELVFPQISSLEEHITGIEDPDFINFISGLLQIDPAKRLTAKEALEHSWFSQSYE